MAFVLTITALIILASVAIHYFTLRLFSSHLRGPLSIMRRWVVTSVLGLLLAHCLEAMLFALGFRLLARSGAYGQLLGMTHHDFSEYCYYSLVTYTSLGFGDMLPTGELRLMTGLETLTGLILIAWSASFLFLQMSRVWEHDNGQ